jgi:hypothetical protein
MNTTGAATTAEGLWDTMLVKQLATQEQASINQVTAQEEVLINQLITQEGVSISQLAAQEEVSTVTSSYPDPYITVVAGNPNMPNVDHEYGIDENSFLTDNTEISKSNY